MDYEPRLLQNDNTIWQTQNTTFPRGMDYLLLGCAILMLFISIIIVMKYKKLNNTMEVAMKRMNDIENRMDDLIIDKTDPSPDVDE